MSTIAIRGKNKNSDGIVTTTTVGADEALDVNLVGGTSTSGASGGSDSSYGVTDGSFTATPTNGTYEIVLSTDNVNGIIITDTMIRAGGLVIFDDSASEKKTVILDNFTWTVATKTLDITNCTNAFLLATADDIDLSIAGPDKGYVAVEDADQVVNLNLDSTRYTTPEPIIDLTNVAAGTYRVSFSAIDFISLFIHLEGSGGVDFTLWATADETADTTADTGWVEVTSDILGAIATDPSAIGVTDTDWKPLKYMIKYVTSDATNAVNAWIIRYN